MMAAVEGQSTESMTVLGLRKLAQATDAVKDRHCLSETHAKTSDPGQAAADYKSYTEPHRGIPCAPEARPWSVASVAAGSRLGILALQLWD